MEHTDKYLKTEDMMLNVIGCVEQYSESRFIASLYTRSYTKIDIQIAINDVRSCLMLVHGELLRLSKYSLEFLDQWATRDNQRFTTAEKMFNRLRSSMAYLRRQYRKSSPIVRGKPTHNPLLTSVYVQKVRFRHLGQLGRRVFGFDTQSNRFVATNNDNITLRPLDNSDWTAPQVTQQDIAWPDENNNIEPRMADE